MASGTPFTPDRRAELVRLLASGRNMEESCAAVEVSRPTVTRWLARGRREKNTDAAQFAAEVDAIREGRADPGLSESDLVRLLERSARNGSVRAIELLLRRLDRDRQLAPAATGDEFAEIDELARRRAGAR